MNIIIVIGWWCIVLLEINGYSTKGMSYTVSVSVIKKVRNEIELTGSYVFVFSYYNTLFISLW